MWAGTWAQRLVADGEAVVDVPAKLAAGARVFDTGNGRKTDAITAIVQICFDTQGRAHYRRRLADGKTHGKHCDA